MVSRTLRRMVVSLSVLILLGIFVLKGREKAHMDNEREDCRHGHCVQDEALAPINDPLAPTPRRAVDARTKSRLDNACTEVCLAYSNRQHKVMSRLSLSLPPLVSDIREADLVEYQKIVDSAVHWILYKEIRPSWTNLSDKAELRAQIRSEFELLRLFGNVCLARHEYPGMLGEMEARMLKRLDGGRRVLAGHGKSDLVDVVDELEVDWTNGIESHQGYTRALVERAVMRARRFGSRDMKETGCTWEKVLQCYVLQASSALVELGYRPKWLKSYEHVPEPDWKTVKVRSQAWK